MGSHKWSVCVYVAIFVLGVVSLAPSCMANTHYYDFEVAISNWTRNCYTKSMMVVNGQYPGPTIDIYEGDRVVVKVNNKGNHNLTIHWHGIQQRRSSWQDGTAYITECPIQPGSYEVYDFIVVNQTGTTFWHAHVNWLRATVYGLFITRPTPHDGYPFPTPYQELPVLLGEWWNEDADLVQQQTLAAGGTFPFADAVTFNGLPGTFYNCSASEGVATFNVQPGKTYLLRVVNAALNSIIFFAIANHTLTVVEADSNYVKPVSLTTAIVVSPGQTLNVLVTANQPPGSYYMVGQPLGTLDVTDTSGIPPQALPHILQDVPYLSTNGVFQYDKATYLDSESTFFPELPAAHDTDYEFDFEKKLKTLHPEKFPTSDHIRHLFYTVGSGTEPCTPEAPCGPEQGPYRLAAQINNISWVNPEIAILVAYWYKISGVYLPNFPDIFPDKFDYTNAATPPSLPGQVSSKGTRVSLVEYGTVIQLVLQDMNNFAFESHPFHLHGQFFYVLGLGFGNYDDKKDPANFNYYDPAARFTVDVPARGWVAIRFMADNPGVWTLHCHFEKHLSWGMNTVFIVKDGDEPDQKLPPPKRINQCVA